MLKISLINIGEIKDKSLISLMNEFKKRLQRYIDFEEITISNSRLNQLEEIKKDETAKIIAKIKKDYYVILLDIKGKQIDSDNFAKLIKDQQDFNKGKICFIIGGSNGISKAIDKFVDYRLSFSKFTFPYALFRVVLLEQIYRACKINANEKYHK